MKKNKPVIGFARLESLSAYLEADVIINAPPGLTVTPERKLAHAMLMTVVKDLTKPLGNDYRDRVGAVRWLNDQRAMLSFDLCCAAWKLDPDATRTALMRLKDGGEKCQKTNRMMF